MDTGDVDDFAYDGFNGLVSVEVMRQRSEQRLRTEETLIVIIIHSVKNHV